MAVQLARGSQTKLPQIATAPAAQRRVKSVADYFATFYKVYFLTSLRDRAPEIHRLLNSHPRQEASFRLELCEDFHPNVGKICLFPIQKLGQRSYKCASGIQPEALPALAPSISGAPRTCKNQYSSSLDL